MNVYVSLTTIPSRFNNVHKTIESLIRQTYTPTKIFLNIPKKYVRFPDQTISDEDIEKLMVLFSDILCINRIEKDSGPGTKLVGVPDYVIEEDAFLIIVDDDVCYNPYMVETHIKQYMKDREVSTPVKRVYGTDFVDIYGKFRMIQVVGSMGIPSRSLKQMKMYAIFIGNFDTLFFVDDLWITYYFVKKNYEIVAPGSMEGVSIPPNTFTTDIDGLVHLGGAHRRGKLLQEGYFILRGGDADNRFWFLNNE